MTKDRYDELALQSLHRLGTMPFDVAPGAHHRLLRAGKIISYRDRNGEQYVATVPDIEGLCGG